MEYQQEQSDQQKGGGVEKEFWFHPGTNFWSELGSTLASNLPTVRI